MFETSNFKNKIKQYSPLLQDNKMHARIGDIDFVDEETAYHTIRLEQVTNQKIQTRKKWSCYQSRSIHDEAFQFDNSGRDKRKI